MGDEYDLWGDLESHLACQDEIADPFDAPPDDDLPSAAAKAALERKQSLAALVAAGKALDEPSTSVSTVVAVVPSAIAPIPTHSVNVVGAGAASVPVVTGTAPLLNLHQPPTTLALPALLQSAAVTPCKRLSSSEVVLPLAPKRRRICGKTTPAEAGKIVSKPLPLDEADSSLSSSSVEGQEDIFNVSPSGGTDEAHIRRTSDHWLAFKSYMNKKFTDNEKFNSLPTVGNVRINTILRIEYRENTVEMRRTLLDEFIIDNKMTSSAADALRVETKYGGRQIIADDAVRQVTLLMVTRWKQ